jgi:hypothetical protein
MSNYGLALNLPFGNLGEGFRGMCDWAIVSERTYSA